MDKEYHYKSNTFVFMKDLVHVRVSVFEDYDL